SAAFGHSHPTPKGTATPEKGSRMIDWLTMEIPLRHSEPIGDGHVLSLGQSGDVEWQSVKRLAVVGSHDSRVHVRTSRYSKEPCTHLYVEGNPAKWFQGHNLWGSDDLHALAVELCYSIADRLGLEVHPDDASAWLAGAIRLTRVDVTASFHL